MKDKLKKVFASLAVFALALGVVVASAVPAQAVVTVTINNNHPASGTEDGPSYNWYVMMWASVGSGNAVSYYVDKQALATALDELSVDGHDMFTVTRVGETDQWNVVLNDKIAATDETAATAFTGEEVAAALDTIKDNAEQSGTVARSTDSNKTFDINDNGYVLIESSLGTKLLADTFSSKTVTEKNVYPSSDKKQSKSANGTYADDTLSAEIGQTIYYHVDITVPSTASKAITVVDTISSGLTINPTVSWSATHGTTGNGTWTEDATREATATPTGSKVYTFTIPASTVQTMAQAMRDNGYDSTTVTIAYSATVNSSAITLDKEQNKAHIEYDNYVTPDDEVDVYTYRFNLLKYDAAVGTGSQLAGATFQLLKGDSKTPVSLVATDSSNPHYQYRVATSADSADDTVTTITTFDTVSGNNIVIAGLDKNETYYLRETDAPEGYSQLTEDVQVNFDNGGTGRTLANADLTPANPVVEIENHQGSVLPNTGGMGTTVFYIVGAVLIAGGVALFVMNRKKNAASRS